MTNGVQWQGFYEAEMLELNPAQLPNNIGIAHADIRERCQELMRAGSSGSSEERSDRRCSLQPASARKIGIEVAPRSPEPRPPNRHIRRNIMKRACRDLSAASGHRRRSATVLLRHARFVTDPKELAQLYAQANKRKRFAKRRREDATPDNDIS